jgi:hypothetical protein
LLKYKNYRVFQHPPQMLLKHFSFYEKYRYINVHRSSPSEAVSLVTFSCILNIPDRISKNPQISNLMRIRQMEGENFHADGLKVAFRSVANAPKKGSCHCPRHEGIQGSGGIAPLITHRATYGSRQSALRPGPLYHRPPPQGKSVPGNPRVADWVGPSVGPNVLRNRKISFPCRCSYASRYKQAHCTFPLAELPKCMTCQVLGHKR